MSGSSTSCSAGLGRGKELKGWELLYGDIKQTVSVSRYADSFSASVIKTMAKPPYKEFILAVVPEGYQSIVAGRHSNKQQARHREQGAQSSPIFTCKQETE